MTEIKVLKRYSYRGYNIAIRLIGRDVIEYLFARKGSIFTQSYDMTEDPKRRKLKEIGAATLIVCSAAEAVVDKVIERYGITERVKKLLGFRKVEGAKNQHTNGNQKESAGARQGTDPRHEGPSEAPEPHR